MITSTREELRLAIERDHGCSASWRESVAIHEKLDNRTVWRGVVDVFRILGHPHAKHAYAWPYVADRTMRRRLLVSVLGVPPIDSALIAVRASIWERYVEGILRSAAEGRG